MTREKALEISDALVGAGISHLVSVHVTDKFVPRERYSVNVTPTLTYAATDITALQRLADHLDCEIAYCAGSFTFTQERTRAAMREAVSTHSERTA